VFHPPDFTLLNKRLSNPRLGHAFSVHGLSGNLGWASAPVFLAALAGLFDCRTPLLCAAFLPFAVLALLFGAVMDAGRLSFLALLSLLASDSKSRFRSEVAWLLCESLTILTDRSV